MILKEYINDKKRLVEELSKRSRLLIEKGPAYQNNIGYLISEISIIFDTQNVAPLTYHFILHPKILYDCCYYYKFYDTVEKKLQIAKFIFHFHILKVMVLNLKISLVKIKKTLWQLGFLMTIQKFGMLIIDDFMELIFIEI